MKHAPKHIDITIPGKSEDDDSIAVAIVNRTAYVWVKGVKITLSHAGPKSYGDYYKGAWHLVLFP